MAADNQQQDASQYTSIYSLAIPAGIKRDGTVFQNDQFTDGVWCRFQRGDAKKIGGYRSIFSSLVGIYRGMVSQPYNGVNYVFGGTANGLDVFTTGTTFAAGSGPLNCYFLNGSVFANVNSNTTTQVVVPGNAVATFGIGTEIVLEQTIGTPTVYTITGSSYSAGPPAQTTIDFTPAAPAGTIAKIWLNDSIFTPDPRNTWQFDSQFSPSGGLLNLLAHPGKTLQNIDSGVVSQVYKSATGRTYKDLGPRDGRY